MEPRELPPEAVCNTVRIRASPTRNLGSGPLGPPQAQECYSQSISSTPAPGLVTKATSRGPLSLRVPWDTPHHPSRAPSTPTRRTATKSPKAAPRFWNQQRIQLLIFTNTQQPSSSWLDRILR
ncbi:hypothetical protein XENOCAPTIV_008846 [Xenoophorus captivus]|uniref:Uncharacterized protein n=1 Tax=Xenoophorus captivus TaxID=1517983 RepID=A0ABV0SHA7_9TELE